MFYVISFPDLQVARAVSQKHTCYYMLIFFLHCMYNVVLTLWNCRSHLCMPRQKQILHKRLQSILSCKIVIVPLPTKFFIIFLQENPFAEDFPFSTTSVQKCRARLAIATCFFIVQVFIISVCVWPIYKHCIGCCSFYRISSIYESELAWIWSETYCGILLCMWSHQHST